MSGFLLRVGFDKKSEGYIVRIDPKTISLHKNK
jgi:hypothetical protein